MASQAAAAAAAAAAATAAAARRVCTIGVAPRGAPVPPRPPSLTYARAAAPQLLVVLARHRGVRRLALRGTLDGADPLQMRRLARALARMSK